MQHVRLLGPPLPMLPGTYLALRRRMARLDYSSLARSLVCLERFTGRTSAAAMTRLELRLWNAENMGEHLSRAQIEMVRNYVRLDPEIYLQLVDLREMTLRGESLEGKAIPQVCSSCACSFFDPCQHTDGQACAWSTLEPLRCTCCAAMDHDFGDSPRPDPARPLIQMADAAAAIRELR